MALGRRRADAPAPTPLPEPALPVIESFSVDEPEPAPVVVEEPEPEPDPRSQPHPDWRYAKLGYSAADTDAYVSPEILAALDGAQLDMGTEAPEIPREETEPVIVLEDTDTTTA